MSKKVSKHYKNERYKRENFIQKHLKDDGYIVDGFVIDNGHEHGLEVHSVTDNAVIIIHNLSSGKLITKLLARPQQIIRYYKMTGRKPPPEYESILQLARWHTSLNYNSV